MQMLLRASPRAFEAVGQNCRARLNILAGMKHGLIVQTVCFQVVSVYLHQAHAEIASLSVQHFGGGYGLFVGFRLPFECAFDNSYGVGIKPAFHPRHGLQGVGMDIAPALFGEPVERNPLFGVNRGLGVG